LNKNKDLELKDNNNGQTITDLGMTYSVVVYLLISF